MRSACALALLLAVLFVRPDAAIGGDLPWPVSGEVVVGYGAAYGVPGSTRVHRGVDIAAPVGSRVRSPAAAVVAFAGRVPAEEGASKLAVSLDLPDGLRVTLTPLEDVGVTAGQHVTAGQVVGGLAAAEDPSYGGSHLHVGLRRQDVYLDPTTMFEAEVTPAEPVPQSFGPAPPDASAPPAGTPRASRAAPSAEVPCVAPAVVPPAAAPAEPLGAIAPQTVGADGDTGQEGASESGVRRSAGASASAARIDTAATAALAGFAMILTAAVGVVRRRLGTGRA